MILKLLLAPKPAPMQVYKKSPGTPCDQDTVILALYAKDKVNTEILDHHQDRCRYRYTEP